MNVHAQVTGCIHLTSAGFFGSEMRFLMSQSKHNRLSALALALLLLTSACTGDRPTIASAGHDPNTKTSAHSRGCTAEDLASFERLEGEPVLAEKDEMPRGLYLAAVSEVLVEKKTADDLPIARILAREVPGSNNAQIVCSDNVSLFGNEFEMTVTGLVKFDIGLDRRGSGLVARQFYVFAGHDRHGVILSNADPYALSEGVSGFLKNGNAHGQLVRSTDDLYTLRFTREREGSSARMIVRLDKVSN
jgi:hypothetical protein